MPFGARSARAGQIQTPPGHFAPPPLQGNRPANRRRWSSAPSAFPVPDRTRSSGRSRHWRRIRRDGIDGIRPQVGPGALSPQSQPGSCTASIPHSPADDDPAFRNRNRPAWINLKRGSTGSPAILSTFKSTPASNLHPIDYVRRDRGHTARCSKNLAWSALIAVKHSRARTSQKTIPSKPAEASPHLRHMIPRATSRRATSEQDHSQKRNHRPRPGWRKAEQRR